MVPASRAVSDIDAHASEQVAAPLGHGTPATAPELLAASLWTHKSFLCCRQARSEPRQTGGLQRKNEQKTNQLHTFERYMVGGVNHTLHFRAFMFSENKKRNELMKD